eukprot:2757363-Prymnesium_polylepis.1
MPIALTLEAAVEVVEGAGRSRRKSTNEQSPAASWPSREGTSRGSHGRTHVPPEPRTNRRVSP